MGENKNVEAGHKQGTPDRKRWLYDPEIIPAEDYQRYCWAGEPAVVYSLTRASQRG